MSQEAPSARRHQELPVDPRFRQRWVEARRAEGRRRLRILLIVLGVVVVVAGGVALVHSNVFKVRDVVVVGNVHTSRAEIVAASGLTGGQVPMLMVHAGSAAAREAVEALPWVSSVSFRRSWPWTVVVTVRERTPDALVEARTSRLGPAGGGGLDVVDASGRVLEVVAPERAPALPVVEGALGATPGGRVLPVQGLGQGALDELLSAAAVVPAPLKKLKLQLGYSAGLGLVAHVGTDDALVLLGDPAQMPTKLAVLDELIKRVGLAGYSEVDLTVWQRPALTPLANSGQ